MLDPESSGLLRTNGKFVLELLGRRLCVPSVLTDNGRRGGREVMWSHEASICGFCGSSEGLKCGGDSLCVREEGGVKWLKSEFSENKRGLCHRFSIAPLGT